MLLCFAIRWVVATRPGASYSFLIEADRLRKARVGKVQVVMGPACLSSPIADTHNVILSTSAERGNPAGRLASQRSKCLSERHSDAR